MTKVLCPAYIIVCLSVWLSFLLFFFIFGLVWFLKTKLSLRSCRNSFCRPTWPQTQRSACVCLPSVKIKSMDHYAWLPFYFSKKQLHYEVSLLLQSFSNITLFLNLCTLTYKEEHRYVLISGNRGQIVGFLKSHHDSTWLLSFAVII